LVRYISNPTTECSFSYELIFWAYGLMVIPSYPSQLRIVLLFATVNVQIATVTTTTSFAIDQAVTSFPPQWHRFSPRSGHVGFVVDKMGMGQFPCQFSFH
jgi:hypothetical protein